MTLQVANHPPVYRLEPAEARAWESVRVLSLLFPVLVQTVQPREQAAEPEGAFWPKRWTGLEPLRKEVFRCTIVL